MFPSLNDRSFLENENLVRRSDRTEMMRNDEDGPVTREFGDSLLDQRFVDGIDAAGHLVQKQDWRIFQKSARD